MRVSSSSRYVLTRASSGYLFTVRQLGRDEPTYSMDSSGKVVYTRNNEVLSANIQMIQEDSVSDGNRIPLSVKELGTTEVFATSLVHSPNGRFVTVVGDGEYIVYTALAWRNKAFGNGNSFAWAGDSNTYAVLEGRMKVRVYKNFRERGGAGMKGAGSWAIDGLHGGTLLGARGTGFVLFWDWESGDIVRRIEVDAKSVSTWLGPCSTLADSDRHSDLLVWLGRFGCYRLGGFVLCPALRSRRIHC